MTDNLMLGPDARINHLIGVVRATPAEGALADRATLAPGVFFSIDGEGEVSGNYTTGCDGLLHLDYKVGKDPRWIALHLSVGDIDLTDAAVFGVVCKSRAPEAMTFRLCLRSATADGFIDAFLPKHVVAFAQTSTHVDVMQLEKGGAVPAQAAWRELILFFQTQPASVDLIDLRPFIV